MAMACDDRKEKGFVGIIGLLLSVTILCTLGFFVYKAYLRRPVVDKTTQKSLSEHGIKDVKYETLVDTAERKLKGIEQKMLDRENELFDNR